MAERSPCLYVHVGGTKRNEGRLGHFGTAAHRQCLCRSVKIPLPGRRCIPSVLRSLKGFSEPQGVLYVPELNKLYITNAGNGECDVLDGSTYSLLKRIDLGADADNLHYEPATGRMYISAGNNLVILDVADDRQVGAIAFPGHPEGLVLEHDGSRVFVNVPVPSGSVFVVDRAQAAIKSRWPVGNVFSSAISNFPIALDEKHGLLFVGTRAPALLKAIDISSGKTVADAGTDGDADDISYDPERARVYVSCGAGFVDVFQQEDSGRLTEVGRIATAAGGRTSLWVPERGRLFVAVPHRGSHAAEIRVYAAE